MAICDHTWTPKGQFYYKMASSDMAWDTAKTFCENQGGNLATLHQDYYYNGAIDFLSMFTVYVYSYIKQSMSTIHF